MTETIKKQILSIRDSGRTNMFDTNMVQYLANELGYYELVIFLEETFSSQTIDLFISPLQ